MNFKVRHVGLKIQWPLGRAGSSPASSTDEWKAKVLALAFLFLKRDKLVWS